MSSEGFVGAIQKIVEAPPEEIFESAMELFKRVQQMDGAEAVTLWRSIQLFREASPKGSADRIARQLQDAAWVRLEYLAIYDEMKEEVLLSCSQIKRDYYSPQKKH